MDPRKLSAELRGVLPDAIAAGTPGGIERQEAAGQRAMVETAMIPKDIRDATREQLTAIGFKFGADVDELFVACELPSGWMKRGTDHPMHSDLLDEQGRKRATIFYKAAYYDRLAMMTMRRRFHIDPYRDGPRAGYVQCVVMDGDTEVFGTGECERDDFRCRDKAYKACEDWLNTTYPEWQNPLACW